MPLCGGYSDIKTADADIQSLFSSPEVCTHSVTCDSGLCAQPLECRLQVALRMCAP